MTKEEIKALEDKSIKIEWLEDVELQVVENIDNNDNLEISNETFKKGEIVEVDVFGINEYYETVDVQFGDGSCVYTLSTNLFKVLKVE